MKIEVIRVPQYMSKKVNVIMVDGIPICTCRGERTTNNILAILQGYTVELDDKRIERIAYFNQLKDCT